MNSESLEANGTSIDINSSIDREERMMTNVCVRLYARICIFISLVNKCYSPKGNTSSLLAGVFFGLFLTVASLLLSFYRKYVGCFYSLAIPWEGKGHNTDLIYEESVLNCFIKRFVPLII